MDVLGAFIFKILMIYDVDDDDVNGIWWFQIMECGFVLFLFLFVLFEGWVYEGWVVGDDGSIFIG